MAKMTPRTLSGFMELLPGPQQQMERIMEILRRTYSLYGFTPLDTPVIESSEVLLAKGGGETEKQIYRFLKGDTDLSLRFDLTVPLAKYVAQYSNQLAFPFRRFQIGKVYRGERAQRGRFREFYQADIDVIGDGKLDISNEAEIPSIIYKAFTALGLKRFQIRVNNRKILNGFYSMLGLTEQSGDVMRTVDKLDKIARSELIVFNRAEAVNNDAARQELHKLVRQASRKCDIAYEFKDGSVAYDDIPDPLPFDVDAPVIEIPEEFFGIWYMDCMDDPKKYDGKTVKYLAQVCQTPQAGKGAFVPGRFAMTCCVQDIQFVGFPCSYDGYKALEQRAWVRVTAKVGYKFHNIYRGKGPVLTAVSVEPAEKPLEEVVTFS